MSTTGMEIVRATIEQGLAALRADAEAIVIKDQHSYIAAAQIKNDANAYIEDVKAKLGPGIKSAKDHLNRLKNDMAMYVTPAEQIRDTVEAKRIAYSEEEKRRALIEQEREQEKLRAEARAKAAAEQRESDRLAKEQRVVREKELEAQRKAGEIGKREEARLAKQAAEDEARAKALAAEQAKKTAADVKEVVVKANIPVVAGSKNQTFYFSEVVNPAQIIAEYNAALLRSDLERQRFLSQFIMVNEQAVGQFARKTQDNAKATAMLPGVKFTSKG